MELMNSIGTLFVIFVATCNGHYYAPYPLQQRYPMPVPPLQGTYMTWQQGNVIPEPPPDVLPNPDEFPYLKVHDNPEVNLFFTKSELDPASVVIPFNDTDNAMKFFKTYHFRFCNLFDSVEGQLSYAVYGNTALYGASKLACRFPKNGFGKVTGAKVYSPDGALTVHLFPSNSTGPVINALDKLKTANCKKGNGINALANYIQDRVSNKSDKFVLQLDNCFY